MKKPYNECPNGQIIELFFDFLPALRISKKRLNVNRKSYSQIIHRL